ncbi:hypothetical protein ACRN93_13400 [Shewanella baltica]|uniref:hypothetical protein n=1 Tax=Shewanella baltica TaxID=62322 RepID=UPI003D7A0AB4
MKKAFTDLARERNFHHYHFGYSHYKEGNDPAYQGDVSDGILHIRKNDNASCSEHILFSVCLEHPSPFKIPFEKDASKAVAA